MILNLKVRIFLGFCRDFRFKAGGINPVYIYYVGHLHLQTQNRKIIQTLPNIPIYLNFPLLFYSELQSHCYLFSPFLLIVGSIGRTKKMESVNKSGCPAATDTTLYTTVMKAPTIRRRISNYSFTRPYIKSKQSGEVDSDTNTSIPTPLSFYRANL